MSCWKLKPHKPRLVSPAESSPASCHKGRLVTFTSLFQLLWNHREGRLTRLQRSGRMRSDHHHSEGRESHLLSGACTHTPRSVTDKIYVTGFATNRPDTRVARARSLDTTKKRNCRKSNRPEQLNKRGEPARFESLLETYEVSQFCAVIIHRKTCRYLVRAAAVLGKKEAIPKPCSGVRGLALPPLW